MMARSMTGMMMRVMTGVDGVMTKMATEVMVEFLKSQVNIRTYALLFKSEKQVPGIRQNR